MPKFSDIIGQEQMKEHLQKAVELNKVSHAYIINGEKDAGKEFIAKVFSMALQCEAGEDRPCMECRSCRQALSGNQPDIIRITHEKPASIGVEDIRLQLNNDIQIKPYSSPRKVYIIGEGEKMTVQAQNALLKTLEEPPSYAVIIILTTNADAFLPTILSRCILLNMKPVSNELIKKFLMNELQVPDYRAEVCVAFARGNVGRAKSLAVSEEFDKIREEALHMLKYIDEMEVGELIGSVKHIGEYKIDVNDYLDILMIWFRDILMFKATNDANGLVFKDELQSIKRWANKSAYEGIETIINAIEKTKTRIRANVNMDLALELLMLTIKEN